MRKILMAALLATAVAAPAMAADMTVGTKAEATTSAPATLKAEKKAMHKHVKHAHKAVKQTKTN